MWIGRVYKGLGETYGEGYRGGGGGEEDKGDDFLRL